MFQGEQSDIEWVDERWPKIDFVRTFPPELVEVIFSNLNPESVYSCLQASRMWNNFIEMDDSIWKSLCKNFDKASITDDLKCGLTWKEIFIKNYGIQGISKMLPKKYNIMYRGSFLKIIIREKEIRNNW